MIMLGCYFHFCNSKKKIPGPLSRFHRLLEVPTLRITALHNGNRDTHTVLSISYILNSVSSSSDKAVTMAQFPHQVPAAPVPGI